VILGGNFAKVASGELGAFDVGQAIDVEAEFIEPSASLGGATLAGGSHDNHPSGPLDLRSDKIYYVNFGLRNTESVMDNGN
jgi:hypothetical protein